MTEIKCTWKSQDSNGWNTPLSLKHRTFKLAILYKRSHIISGNFLSRLLSPWEDPKLNNIPNIEYAVRELRHCATDSLYSREITKFVMNNWDYLNPNINRKLRLIFAEGSEVRSIVL